MKVKIKSAYHYLFTGFVLGFIISLAGMTFEDYMHDSSLKEALVEIRHYFTPIFIGGFMGFLALIYRRKRIKQFESLFHFTENLHSLLEINKALISTIELPKVLQIIIDKSTQIINLNTGAIYLHENERLYLGATTPPLPDNFPDVFRYDELANHSHIQKALLLKTPIVINDVSKATLSEAEQIVVKNRSLVSILYIPLIIENRPVGTLILGSTEKKRNFTEQEIDIYNTFSAQAALAIENARLYNNSLYAANELRQQNEEFLTLNEELSENNKRIYEMNESLKVAKEKAEESERLKTAFLNNITHEIRTPLNAIVGFSNIINDIDLSGDKIKTFTKTISESSNQLLSIVDDVLEIALIQAKSSSVINTEFDIINLVNNILSDFKARLTNKEVEFKTTININVDKYLVCSDKAKISAILKHLLDNSRKFTVQGLILFNLEFESDNIILEIADTGIGISQDLQEIIFEPFRQVEAGNSRKFGGNGIGLAIVKANVDMLKGEIQLKSELEVGTSIKVIIPIKPVSKQPEKQKNNLTHNFNSKTILIAEDEYSNFFYLSELLADTKANILYASNGQEAIDVFKNESHIDLILMDLKMPVMDGLTAAKQIKKLNSKIPIIAQTAYLLDKIDEPEGDSGLDEIINKPIKKELLFDVLNKYLSI